MKNARMLNLGFFALMMTVGAISASTPACSSGNMGSDPSVTAGAAGTPVSSMAGSLGIGGSGTSTHPGVGGNLTNAGSTSLVSTTTGGATAAQTTAAVTSICTSKTTWRAGENQTMRPGEACINCHSSNPEAPTFVVAGTVYPTAHEPADCNGSNSNGTAKVIITDATGMEHSVTVNSAGNFMLQGASIPLPYNARVEVGTMTRAMGASQTSGDCNGCHTESGVNGAPGRIMLP